MRREKEKKMQGTLKEKNKTGRGNKLIWREGMERKGKKCRKKNINEKEVEKKIIETRQHLNFL